MTTAAEVRAKLGTLLVSADRITSRPGIATGWTAFDEHLIWQGLPQGELTLFSGEAGLGATTLWAQAAARVTTNKRWCAWVNAANTRICPWALRQLGIDFRYFMIVGPSRDREQLLWVLQEIISLSLFELIGCDLGELHLRAHQFIKLRRSVQHASVALVMLSPHPIPYAVNSFSLALEFTTGDVCLTRALHRPTPLILPRRNVYADLMPQLAQSRTSRSGRDLLNI